MKADEALNKLIDGNLRYVQAALQGVDLDSSVKRHRAILKQKPFAIILGCADSRVAPEQLFDQGIGDLFVVRVAGNIAQPSQIGSIEFACQNFGSQLVVVLGHSGCGAIAATVNAVKAGGADISVNLAAIVDQVVPAVLPVVNNDKGSDHDVLLHKAMQANVEHSMQQLSDGSQIIDDLIKQDKLKVVGADYSIETGKVEFYI